MKVTRIALVLLMIILLLSAFACGPAAPVTAGIAIYSDQACSQPIAFFDWGTVSPSASNLVIPIWIKNTGDTVVWVTADNNPCDPPTGTGTVFLEAAPPLWYAQRDIEPGQIKAFYLCLDIFDPDPGDYYFEIAFYVRSGPGEQLLFDEIFGGKVSIAE